MAPCEFQVGSIKERSTYTNAPVVLFERPLTRLLFRTLSVRAGTPDPPGFQEGGMATKADEALERLQSGQEALTTAVAALGEVLRSIAEQLALVLERLTPQASDGPTLQELLAELVGRGGDNGALLRRIGR